MSPSEIGPSAMITEPSATAAKISRRCVDRRSAGAGGRSEAETDTNPFTGEFRPTSAALLPGKPAVGLHQIDETPCPHLVAEHVEEAGVLPLDVVVRAVRSRAQPGGNQNQIRNEPRKHPGQRLDDHADRPRGR